ncbi:MAG: hypothetical protein IJR67_01250 [Acholeplasmatales bacterium]|nr:hypothetical protein [Acholeplasmatales bacterium]
MDRDYEYEEGVSLGQILKVFFGRWKQFLVITALVTVVAILGIMFIYNKPNQVYSSTFKYNTSDLNNGKYVDGSSFDYTLLSSEKVLTEVKNSNEKFKDLDVTKLSQNFNSAITIKTNVDKDTKAFISFTITIKKNAFSNDQIGKDFITALTEYPLTHSLDVINKLSFDTYLNAAASSTTLDVKVNYLLEQITYLEDGYQALIDQFGDQTYNGKPISKIKTEFEALVRNNYYKELANELENYQYALDFANQKGLYETLKGGYEKKYQELEMKISNYNKRIKEIAESGGDLKDANLSAITSSINTLVAEQTEVRIKADNITLLLESHDPTSAGYDDYIAAENAYIAKVNNVYSNVLVPETTNYANIYKAMYQNNLDVLYQDDKIAIKGGLNTFVTIIISLLAGVLCAGIVNLIVDRNKLSPNYKEEAPIKEEQKKEIEAEAKDSQE